MVGTLRWLKRLYTQKTACNGICPLEVFGFQFVLAHALYG
jgi:hypothetical protein